MGYRDPLAALARMYLAEKAREGAEIVSREWDERQAQWEQRQEEHIARWTEQHNANTERIERIDANLYKLTDMRFNPANAKKRDYLEKIDGWIKKDEAKRDALVARNQELESKIQDVNDKLAAGGAKPWFYQERNTYGQGTTIRFRLNPTMRLTRTVGRSTRSNIRKSSSLKVSLFVNKVKKF